jgi:hypothetical protein
VDRNIRNGCRFISSSAKNACTSAGRKLRRTGTKLSGLFRDIRERARRQRPLERNNPLSEGAQRHSISDDFSSTASVTFENDLDLPVSPDKTMAALLLRQMGLPKEIAHDIVGQTPNLKRDFSAVVKRCSADLAGIIDNACERITKHGGGSITSLESVSELRGAIKQTGNTIDKHVDSSEYPDIARSQLAILRSHVIYMETALRKGDSGACRTEMMRLYQKVAVIDQGTASPLDLNYISYPSLHTKLVNELPKDDYGNILRKEIVSNQ